MCSQSSNHTETALNILGFRCLTSQSVGILYPEGVRLHNLTCETYLLQRGLKQIIVTVRKNILPDTELDPKKILNFLNLKYNLYQ